MAMKTKKASPPLAIPIGIGFILLLSLGVIITKKHTPPASIPTIMKPVAFDFGNQTVMVNNEELLFINAKYRSSEKEHTARITNRQVDKSQTKAAAILVDSPGGSGTFFYLIGSLLIDGKETYSKPYLLGDRVVIESLKVEDNKIILNYLDRPVNAPMAFTPTVPVSATFSFDTYGNLVKSLH